MRNSTTSPPQSPEAPRDEGRALSGDPRRHLAQQQEQLISALFNGAAPPAGFDQLQLESTSASLLRKRTRGIEKLAPWLQTILTDCHQTLLEAYLRQHPTPPPAGHVQ